MGMKDVLRDGFIKEGSTGRQAARMLALVPVRGNQISTVGRAVDGNLAFGAAADGANLLRLGGTESGSFALLTDCAGPRHERLLNGQRQFRRIRRGGAKHKRASPAAQQAFCPKMFLGNLLGARAYRTHHAKPKTRTAKVLQQFILVGAFSFLRVS